MGYIGPKGKTSKARRNKRRAQNYRIAMPNIAKCTKCGEYYQPHRACKACGSYNKRTVLDVEE